MVLVIDNFDSFTYNLVQYLGELGATPVVYRNDAIDVGEIEALAPERIRDLARARTARGRGHLAPRSSGCSARAIPMLGVCLGHQAIGQVFGAASFGRRARCTARRRSSSTTAGACSRVCRGPFDRRPLSLAGGRRRGVARRRSRSPARAADDGVVMALRHRAWPVHGVQFHPESVLTAEGRHLLRNFLAVGRDGS